MKKCVTQNSRLWDCRGFLTNAKIPHLRVHMPRITVVGSAVVVQKGYFKKCPYAAGNCTQIFLTMSVVKVKLFSTSAGASKWIPCSIIECFTLDLVPVVERGIAFTRTGFIVE